jgi:hypothetical protein
MNKNGDEELIIHFNSKNRIIRMELGFSKEGGMMQYIDYRNHSNHSTRRTIRYHAMFKFPMGQNASNTCFSCLSKIRICRCTKDDISREAWSRLLELQEKYGL